MSSKPRRWKLRIRHILEAIAENLQYTAGMNFEQFGNDPKTAAVAPVFQWRKGKRVEIYPESIADGKIEKPAWMK